MNKLPLDKRVQILTMLCEGSSMRSISRVVDCSINTVTGMLEKAGKVCAAYHDENVRRFDDGLPLAKPSEISALNERR